MKNSTEIVRNFSVFCAESKLRNAGIEIELEHSYKQKPLISISAINRILIDLYNEQADYRTLLIYYSEALQGNENVYFS